MSKTKIEKLNSKIDEINKELEKHHKELNELRSKQSFLCVCGKRHRFCDCDAIIDLHWSNEPYNEGYEEDRGIKIICPKTLIENRIYFPNEYNVKRFESREYKFKSKYRKYFKSVATRQIDYSVFYVQRNFTNNTYIDENWDKYK